MSTWDDKPNDYEHALAVIEQLQAALKPFADAVDYCVQDMEPYRQAYRVLYGLRQNGD